MHHLQLNDIEDTDNTPQDLMMTMEMLEPKLIRIPALNCMLFDQTTGSTHPGHLANVLSTSKTKHAKDAKFMNKPKARPSPLPKEEEIVVNDKRYHQVQVHHIFYSVSSHKS